MDVVVAALEVLLDLGSVVGLIDAEQGSVYLALFDLLNWLGLLGNLRLLCVGDIKVEFCCAYHLQHPQIFDKVYRGEIFIVLSLEPSKVNRLRP